MKSDSVVTSLLAQVTYSPNQRTDRHAPTEAPTGYNSATHAPTLSFFKSLFFHELGERRNTLHRLFAAQGVPRSSLHGRHAAWACVTELDPLRRPRGYQTWYLTVETHFRYLLQYLDGVHSRQCTRTWNHTQDSTCCNNTASHTATCSTNNSINNSVCFSLYQQQQHLRTSND